MASLEDEAGGVVSGAGAPDGGRAAAPGDVPAPELAQGGAPKPDLGVDRAARLASPQAREVDDNVVLYGEPAAPPLSAADGGITETERAIATHRMTHPDATPAQIAEATGTTKSVVTRVLNTPAVRRFMSPILDEQGASLREAAKAIGDALKAEKVQRFAYKGDIVEACPEPDHDVRVKAAKVAMEGHGALEPAPAVNINMVNLTDQQLAEIAAGKKTLADFTPTRPA